MAAAALPAAGATLRPADRALQLRSAHLPATAAMAFQGPLLRETQPLHAVPITHEYQRHEYMSGAVYGRSVAERRAGTTGGDLAGGVAGDGSKFSAGFFRGRAAGEELGSARAAADEAACARSHARDAQRAHFITANARRTGFNPITGAEEAPGLDCYRPRGRVALQDSAGPLRAVENVTRDAEPGVRMHRVEDAGGARAQARAATLQREGLTVTGKFSSELGYGRRALPSGGVGEALAGAAYGGTRAASASDYAATTSSAASSLRGGGSASASSAGAASDPPLHLVKSGVFGRGVWDVRGGLSAGGEEQQLRAGALAAARARNRVFDEASAPVTAPAVGDDFVRHARESRELAAARPPRPLHRPASFTATARALTSLRASAARSEEVASVASLRF